MLLALLETVVVAEALADEQAESVFDIVWAREVVDEPLVEMVELDVTHEEADTVEEADTDEEGEAGAEGVSAKHVEVSMSKAAATRR